MMPPPLSREAAAVIIAALVPAALGCAETESASNIDPLKPDEPASIGPVKGTIAGSPFTLAAARYTIDPRPNVGRFQLTLSASAGGAPSPCPGARPPEVPSIWLRYQEAARPGPGRIEIAPKKEIGWTAHYQIRQGGVWRGNGNARAVLVFEDVTASGALPGKLSICFGDEKKSCANGTFTAERCPDPVYDLSFEGL